HIDPLLCGALPPGSENLMSLVSRLTSLLRSAARSPAVRRGARSLSRAAVQAVKEQRSDTSGHGAGRAAGKAAGRAAAGADSARALADRRGATPLTLEYAPRQDGHPDPGEVVWAWVPYEEDLSQGKDRPVLVIAEEPAATGGSDGTGEVLVALMLTS